MAVTATSRTPASASVARARQDPRPVATHRAHAHVPPAVDRCNDAAGLARVGGGLGLLGGDVRRPRARRRSDASPVGLRMPPPSWTRTPGVPRCGR
jgi:hypothetical protein